MPTVEAKKRIQRSFCGLGFLARNRRPEVADGQAVRTVAPSRIGSEQLKTSEIVFGPLAFRLDAPVSGFKADSSGTGIP